MQSLINLKIDIISVVAKNPGIEPSLDGLYAAGYKHQIDYNRFSEALSSLIDEDKIKVRIIKKEVCGRVYWVFGLWLI